ncbi:unnamed protein product [Owenia fusiformis]|uniref:UDP-glucuronosyltransferase n=1 Tax=Owenia fusiformis TaxID=6347 RepID=A0A8J1XSN3_OWEFU|nr:unnamed protein product [Owenia fusiformis]
MLMLLLLVFCGVISETVWAVHILLIPYTQGTNSRLMNMEKLADILIQDGHSVSLMINNRYDEENRPISKDVKIYKFKIPDDAWLVTDDAVVAKAHNTSFIEMASLVKHLTISYCEALLKSGILHELKKIKFDLVLVDYVEECARLSIDYLDIATVTYSNEGGLVNTYFGHLNHPAPWSFVTPFVVGFPDDMRFSERVQSTLINSVIQYVYYTMLLDMDTLRIKYKVNASLSTMNTLSRKTSLHFSNNHFVLDYPRPVMPNHVNIGGMYFQPPNPLSGHIDNIVKNASPGGVIIVSFGSIFNPTHGTLEYVTEQMASAFAGLTYTVIWKYPKNSKPPKSLGKNTHLVNWLPQNDLLGHPKTKLFITHCGVSSTYETIYHAVPVITIPIAVDQFKHSTQLTKRLKMGIELRMDHREITNTSLVEAILSVLEDPKYKENAKIASRLIQKNINKPRDVFLFWINYVIETNGAKHLVSKPLQDLSFFQYFMLDVLIFLAVILAVIVTIIFIIIRWIFRCVMCLFKNSKQKDD